MKQTLVSKQKIVPLLFILPQLMVIIVFFIWPALNSLIQAFSIGDVFGENVTLGSFVNFVNVYSDPIYINTILITFAYSFIVSIITILFSMVLALLVNNVYRGRSFYKTVFIWPYAVAPVIAAVLFKFLFNPSIGLISNMFENANLNYIVNAADAFFIIAITAIWQQSSYNFIFLLTGLYVIPKEIHHAAAIDGTGAINKFKHITLPLLAPTIFFLFIINLLYAFFDTFGIVHILTQGGPAYSTLTMIYKVYSDGFLGLDVGGAAVQSVTLMLIVILLVFIQFKYIDKKIHY